MHRKGLHTENESLPTCPTKTEQGHQKESEKRIVYRCSSRPITIFFRSNPRLNALQTILRYALFDIDLVSFQRAL